MGKDTTFELLFLREEKDCVIKLNNLSLKDSSTQDSGTKRSFEFSNYHITQLTSSVAFPSHAAMKLLKDFFIYDPKEGHEKYVAFWIAFSNNVTLNLDIILSTLYHICLIENRDKIIIKLAKAFGILVQNNLINSNSLQMIYDFIDAVLEFKELESTDPDLFEKRTSGLLLLKNALRIHGSYMDSSVLEGIDMFSGKFMDSIIEAFKKFMEDNNLSHTPSVEEIETLFTSLSHKNYLNNPHIKTFINKLVKINIEYFKLAIGVAAQHPGLIPKKMKQPVRDMLTDLLQNFVIQSKKPQAHFNHCSLIIAKVLSVSQEHQNKNILLCIQKSGPHNYRIINLQDKILNLIDLKTTTALAMDLMQYQQKYYLVIKKPMETLIQIDQGPDELEFLHVDNGALKDKLMACYQDLFLKERLQYTYNAVEFKNIILPVSFFKEICKFLNFDIFSEKITAKGELYEQKFQGKSGIILRYIKGIKKIPPDVMNKLRTALTSVMSHTLVIPMSYIAALLTENTDENFPYTQEEQSKKIALNLEEKSGLDYIQAAVLHNFLQHNNRITMEEKFYGSILVFLEKQQAGHEKNNKPTPSSTDYLEKHSKILSQQHYLLLKSLKPQGFSTISFYHLVLTDMLINKYELSCVFDEIKNARLPLKDILEARVLHQWLEQKYQHEPMNLFTLAILTCNMNFFRALPKHYPPSSIKPHGDALITRLASSKLDSEFKNFVNFWKRKYGTIDPSAAKPTFFPNDNDDENHLDQFTRTRTLST